MSQTILKVEGMTCNHCKMRVEKALQGLNNVESVKVDLVGKEAVVTGAAERSSLVKAVEEAGYSVVE
ncbi:MAG: cation transporter [Desulfitobacteriaceae bacterium]